MPGNRKQRGVHIRRYQLGDKNAAYRAALKPKQALRIGQADRKGKTPHFFSRPVCRGSGVSRQGIQVGRAPREVVAVLEAVERRKLLLHQHRGRQDARVRGWHRSHLEPRGHKIRRACKLPLGDTGRGSWLPRTCLPPQLSRPETAEPPEYFGPYTGKPSNAQPICGLCPDTLPPGAAAAVACATRQDGGKW